MGDTVQLLHDTHLLVVDHSPMRATLTGLLRGMGATVHTADTQMQAVGMYYRLYRQHIRPRAVITDWWLKPRESAEHAFLARYCPDEDPCSSTTVVELLSSVHDLDPTTFLAVYTNDVDDARFCLSHRNIPAVIIDRADLAPADFVIRLASHEGIARQRQETSIVRAAVASLLRPFRTPKPGLAG